MILKRLIFVALTTFLFYSCAKEVMGPKGDPGPQGAQGGQGPVGPKGDTGNADVEQTSFTIVEDSWTWDAGFQEWYFEYYANSLPKTGAMVGYLMTGRGKQAMPCYD